MTNIYEVAELTSNYLKISNEYKKCLGDSNNNPYGISDANKVIKICNELRALGWEWGDSRLKQTTYYDYLIDADIRICKGIPRIKNPSTNYDFKDDYYIIWDNGNIGRFQFVDSSIYYNLIEDEWKEFIKILNSYEPLDYDSIFTHHVYSIENGKKLASDYDKICKEIRNKINLKIKYDQLSKLQNEIDKLKKIEKGIKYKI